MTVLFVVPFFLVLTLGLVNLIAVGKDRLFLWRIVTLAWIILLPLTALVNNIFPFAGGGDDEGYFRLGATTVPSIGEAFDPTRFFESIEQPGYPWLLSILNYFSGPDLLTFKVLNLALYIILAMVWFRIGVLLQDSTFGRRAMVAVLLLTPLWYYFFFLLKDMVITLLQSLFLLGLVEQRRHKSLRAWLLITVPVFALLLFRTPLVLQSSAVLLASLLLVSLSRRGKRMIPAQIMGWITVAGLLVVGSDPDLMRTIGIDSESRLLTSEAIAKTASRIAEESRISRVMFPLVYLVSETSGLSPEAWAEIDPSWLRGLLALPWIFVVVPFFLLGAVWVTRTPRVIPYRLFRWRDSRLVATPWGILALFILSYAAISWKIGDTTRWRIPDMPVIAVMALAGWRYTLARGLRRKVLLLWMTGITAFSFIYYLFKS